MSSDVTVTKISAVYGETYLYHSKASHREAEWEEVRRDIQHARLCVLKVHQLVDIARVKQHVAQGVGLHEIVAGITDVKDPSFVITRALMESAIVSYARAFTSDSNGREAALSREDIKDRLELVAHHDVIMRARNKIVAHSASGQDRSMYEVVFQRGGISSGPRAINSATIVEDETLIALPRLLEDLEKIFVKEKYGVAYNTVLQELRDRVSKSEIQFDSVQFVGDNEHELVPFQPFDLVNPWANQKRRTSKDKKYRHNG